MASLRDFGYKVYTLLNDNPSRKDELCKQLNFSDTDLKRLTCGRLAVTPNQVKTIAAIFKQDPEDLLTYENNDSYSAMVNCISSFSSQKNCNEVLDLIDSYIDIKEAASNLS